MIQHRYHIDRHKTNITSPLSDLREHILPTIPSPTYTAKISEYTYIVNKLKIFFKIFQEMVQDEDITALHKRLIYQFHILKSNEFYKLYKHLLNLDVSDNL